MKKPLFTDALSEIVAADPRYDQEAYLFVREALDFTIKMLNKPKEGPGRHVRGEELLDGLRQYALKEFGPLAKTVLGRWGIHACVDFGHMVFNLVQHGVLGKTDEDRLEDFAGGYDFEEAFRKPFWPRSRTAAGSPAATE
jgi:uncharacterized repeat protein (TIGR04138 family)